MTTEVLTRQQKRQAIARGLSQYLSHTALEKELRYWEEMYGDKPAFVLNRFVHDICQTEVLKRQRKEILRQVLYEMAEAERDAHHQTTASAQYKRKASNEGAGAFRLMLEIIMQHIVPNDVQDFETDIKLKMKQRNFSLGSAAQLNPYVYADLLSPSQYAAFLTLVYEMFCSFYGPVRADYVYARGKEQVKIQFPTFNLHELL
jgi:hypothetical protein